MTTAQARHWRSAADALSVLRREAVLTRPQLGRHLGLDSGPTSDLVKRLTRAELVVERRAPATGPGRPTTTVHAHPAGPLTMVVDVRHGDWRIGTCDLAGEVTIAATGRHDGTDPETLLDRLSARIAPLTASLKPRIVGVGVAMPGPVAEHLLAQMTMLGWHDLPIARIAPDPDLPVVMGNDATMAAVAEARLHSPHPYTLLHVVVEVGVGGAFIVDGRPTPSARGLHGEFGHLPFGDPAAACPCGARGCWTVAFDAPAIARRTHVPAEPDPRAWLHRLYTDPAPTPEIRATRLALAVDLGRGLAGLINALDPDLITLGGLAAHLRDAATDEFDRAVHDGLMIVHRDPPPRIVTALSGADAALIGVGLSAFDRVLDAEMLARWASRTPVSR
ncbi:ROK family transcriptional regulator [Amycolatopsis sp. CA-126428]|uniref:ROK family transcriptional regulator n=1 Tax=Amycolatopsis sp. CA-126428 TaxID=2073158 RepID=UPI000CD2537E|nr:ROK family transcriptional regulator [Amycolatopsis sp. CA-126428]